MLILSPCWHYRYDTSTRYQYATNFTSMLLTTYLVGGCTVYTHIARYLRKIVCLVHQQYNSSIILILIVIGAVQQSAVLMLIPGSAQNTIRTAGVSRIAQLAACVPEQRPIVCSNLKLTYTLRIPVLLLLHCCCCLLPYVKASRLETNLVIPKNTI